MSLLIKLKARRTRYGLLRLKDQLEIAQKAHDLLEEKYRILMQEAQDIRRTLVPFQHKLQSKIEAAYALLSETIISLGVHQVDKAARSSEVNDELEIRWSTVRGISIPQLKPKIRKRTPLERGYELRSTNYVLDRTAEVFEELLSLLVGVAELENILRIFEGEIEKIEIRVSALEKVLIPSLKHEIKMIENRLEEKERESHIMVKWIKEKSAEFS